MTEPADQRDHGGGLDAAIAAFGGRREDWLDLSTGINPVPYPVGELPPETWQQLPDQGAMDRLLAAARAFWHVPASLDIVAVPGASALIARLPHLIRPSDAHVPVWITEPTYNEWRAAFGDMGVDSGASPDAAPIHIHVHPNNPDGRLLPPGAITASDLTIIDESFCDVAPELSHVGRAADSRVMIVKSFGKFWGLAGLRLGFVIARPEFLRGHRAPGSDGSRFGDLRESLGPWPISGPALRLGARALEDIAWAQATRDRLAADSARLDALMRSAGAGLIGGTTLFRTYDVTDAAAWQARLAQHHIWTRIFPYSGSWIRLGLPGNEAGWSRIEAAL